MLKSGHSIRTAITAISLLWVGSLIGSGLAFLTQVVLARHLNPAGYGIFTASLATVTLLVPLAGFGVQQSWLKLFGAEGWAAVRWLPASFRFIVLSTVGVFLTIVFWAVWGPHDAEVRQLLLWLLPVPIGYMFLNLVSSKLQLEERYSSLAWWHLLTHLARLLLVLLALTATNQLSSYNVAAVYVIVALSTIIAGLMQLRAMTGGRFTLKGHSQPSSTEIEKSGMRDNVRVCDIARESWPFALGSFFTFIYFQSAIILLKYISGDEAAGIFNAAFTVMTAAYLLPGTIYQSFLLPKVHRWANHDRLRFLHAYRFGNGLMLLLGAGFTCAMLLLVPWVIPLLFGAAYQKAVGLLTVLAFCLPLRFLASSVGATLVTQDHMQRKVLYMMTTAIINVLLNLMLISIYGTMGAAIATILSELALLVLYLLGARRYVFGPDAWRGWTLRYKATSI